MNITILTKQTNQTLYTTIYTKKHLGVRCFFGWVSVIYYRVMDNG